MGVAAHGDISAGVQNDRGRAPRLSPGGGAVNTQRDDELYLDHHWDPRFAAWAAEIERHGRYDCSTIIREMTEMKWISFRPEPREYPI